MTFHVAPNQKQIRDDYHACRVGYDTSLLALINTGLSAAEADAFLFCRELSEAQPHRDVFETARVVGALTRKEAPVTVEPNGLVRVERDYLISRETGEVWVEKTSKNGRKYLSTITSVRKIRRLTKLAVAGFAALNRV